MADPQSKIDKGGAFTGISVRKADDTTRLITNASTDPDDSFAGMYSSGDKGEAAIIEPTFKPATLRLMTTMNNILLQCVAAMEVSIDGTGHSIEPIHPEEDEDDLDETGNAKGGKVTKKEPFAKRKKDINPQEQTLIDFFDEPYPGKSMIALRRSLRNDIESTGNGYMEVIRNAADQLVMVNDLNSEDMRLIRLDAAVLAEKTVIRSGKPMKVNVRVRERRFVQVINGVKTYFKEYRASRDLDRDTGLWAPKGTRLPLGKRASEVVHFKLLKDSKSPYGLPRWINQLPSVLGSRKAEEFNLEFFDSGGLPPVLVLVQGGYLSEGVKESLTAHLGGKAHTKHRAAVVEAIASSGSLDSSGSVKVTVERFGTERQQDSMFQAYDKNAEEHVRTAFRLPPMFVGRAQDYNFATAMTGYMVAEAQVFATERLSFDEVMWWLVEDLGVDDYTFKSKPLSLTDVANQLKAIELATAGNYVNLQSALEALNTLTGLSLTYQEPPPPPDFGAPALEGGAVFEDEDPELLAAPAIKSERATEILKMADEWSNVLGLSGSNVPSEDKTNEIMVRVSTLKDEDLRLFTEAMATRSLVATRHDLKGLAELCGSAVGR